jgi:hypothetical protein
MVGVEEKMRRALCDFVSEGDVCENCNRSINKGDSIWWIADGGESPDGAYIGKCCLPVFFSEAPPQETKEPR